MHSDTFITAEEKRKIDKLRPNSYRMKQAILKLRGKSSGFNIIAHNENDILDLYKFTEKDKIGQGNYGNVVKAEHLPTGDSFFGQVKKCFFITIDDGNDATCFFSF